MASETYLGEHCSGNRLLLDGTKPLPEPAWPFIKSPMVAGRVIAFGPFAPPPTPPPPLLFCQHFQLSGRTPEANFLKPHMVNLCVWENLAPISVTLGQGHKANQAGQSNSVRNRFVSIFP